MTSPLQRKLFESHLTTSPSWIELLHQLPIDLSDYTSFLDSYSDTVLSPAEDQLQIEDLFEDELFEDITEETTELEEIMPDKYQTPYSSPPYSSSTFKVSSCGEAPQTWRSTESTLSTPQGTTARRTSEQPGQLLKQDTLRLDESGKLIGEQPATTGRIEYVSEADKEPLERMEDGYTKQEGRAEDCGSVGKLI